MGDVLGGVFGGGKQVEEEQKLDPTTKALNEMRFQQLSQLFSQSPYASFAQPRSDIYSLDPQTKSLINDLTSDDNMMTLDQYLNKGMKAGQNYMTQIASPEIAQSLALQGMEGSGAMQEALAKGGAQVGLQFLQTIPGFMSAQTQQGTQLANLSDMSRQLREQDLLRQQGVVTTGLTGLPYTPAVSKSGGESSLPLFNLFGMGGSL